MHGEPKKEFFVLWRWTPLPTGRVCLQESVQQMGDNLELLFLHCVRLHAAEVGSGPGSYDIRKSVWHVNCCNAEINGGGGWGIFNAILGWENSATYGSVISYNVYWLAVIIAFASMRYYEKHGHWPLMKPKTKYVDESNAELGSSTHSDNADETAEKKVEGEQAPVSTNVREVEA